jgi:hypothetical protein
MGSTDRLSTKAVPMQLVARMEQSAMREHGPEFRFAPFGLRPGYNPLIRPASISSRLKRRASAPPLQR